MKYRLLKIVFVLFLFQPATVFAQDQHPPFWDEIQQFKKSDSLHPPPTNAILFAGSSSFRFWTNVQDYFPSYTIINRGFGGSSLPDVIRYEDDIIFPYHPKQIVIYCGENDFVASDSVTVQMVFQRFTQLFTNVRNRLPNVPVVFVSIKPSPSRWQLKDKMIEENRLIKAFLLKRNKTAFVDVWTAMLDKDGKPMADIFKEDQLHMNAKGYAIWQKLIAPYLKN